MPVNAIHDYPAAVTVLARARDRYNLPIALAQVDKLASLVTDLYWPGDNPFLAAIADRIPGSGILDKRFDPSLPSRLVSVPPASYVYNAMARSGIARARLDRRLSGVLSERARTEALDRACPLFAYSYYAFEAFRPGRERPEHRYIFQLHPHPASVRRILEEELERTPFAKESLLNEYELSLPEERYQELRAEPHYANGWVVASSYSAATLTENGIPSEQIHVVPYGVKSDQFPPRDAHSPVGQKFTVIFVGSMVQRKGLSDLFDAVRTIGTDKIRIVLCGRGLIDHGLLQKYSDIDLEVNIGLPTAEVVKKMHESDVFVLPSLIEGFGHVILEAMSSGLPVITTEHTSGPDVIVQGEHGFIVPIRSPHVLAERLDWCLSNRTLLREMGDLAAKKARTFTWERFHRGIQTAYGAMYESVNLTNTV